MNSIYLFYGYSGDAGKPPPAFPGGTDRDKSFQLVAETLGVMLGKLFPKDKVYVRQAWTKDVVMQELENAKEPIRQVHIACHGDSTWLSLAYHFDQGDRIHKRAQKYNGQALPDDERAIAAMKEEDALVAGYLTHGLEPARVTAIKSKHAKDAGWQVWGCYAGYPVDVFTTGSGAELDAYFLRFNLGKSALDGIMVEVAKTFGVFCTAAKGHGGLEFWHGTKAKKVERNDTKTPAKKPFWLWNVAKSVWVSYGPDGKELPKPLIFGVPCDQKDLPKPMPPKWLTDLYYK